jgi:hypothetical protein
MSKPPLGARKDGRWYAICTEPSITKTPIGPVQVPVPYQVLIDLSQATATAPSVNFNGQPAFLLDQSKMQRCMGDEQGTSGGIRSGTTSQEVKAFSGSDSVMVDGKSIVRDGDPCTLNKGNCLGKFIAGSAPTPAPEGSPRVRVHIIPSQRTLCPDAPIELKAVGSPNGGLYTWQCDGPCKLVDPNGNPKNTGDTVYLQLDLEHDDDVEREFVQVSVQYSVNGQSKKDQKSFRIHPPVPLWIVHGLWIGKISSIVSGDDLGVRDKVGVIHRSPTNLFDFKEQPYALIVIPGMNMTYKDTLDMQEACNYTFKVHSSALIQNYTHGVAKSGDIAQSIFSEALGAIDRNAEATAYAVRKGLREKHEVYIVAHSQGSEIFAKALDILSCELTSDEMKRIHYQGFGSETYIHNFCGLGSVRNVRTIGDPIPSSGSIAKGAVAALAVRDLVPSIAPNPLNVMNLKRSIENIRALGNEQWEFVDSPVKFPHYFYCRHASHQHPLPHTDRHKFLTNYWMHVRIPTAGSGKPDYEPARNSKYRVEKNNINEWNGVQAEKAISTGFSVRSGKT